MGESEMLEWLRYAKDDLDAAIFLTGMRPRKIEIICYHCQKCAEKSLKSILCLLDAAIPRTHDLRALAQSAQNILPNIASLEEKLVMLQPDAVAVRYPYEIEVASGDEDSALKNAQTIFQVIADAAMTAVPKVPGKN
jgi:HEPN domain-containing protein